MISEFLGMTKPYFIRTYQYDAADRFGWRISLHRNSEEQYLDPYTKRSDQFMFQGKKIWDDFNNYYSFANTQMLLTNYQVYSLTTFLSFIGGLWTVLSIVIGSIIFSVLRRSFWRRLAEEILAKEEAIRAVE